MNETTSEPIDELLNTPVSCRHLINISPDAVLIHHLGRIVLVNDECVRLFGLSHKDQLIGISTNELAPAESRDFLERLYQRAICNQEHTALVESTVCRQDGVCVPVETIAIPVPRADGTTAVLVVFRDVSIRQRAIEERQRTERQVRTILNTAMDGIISIDSHQNIILFNAAAEAIFGWRADQIIGRSINLLIPTRYTTDHQRHVEQFGNGVIQNRRMSVLRTVLALRATGEEFPIEASISQTTIDGEKVYTVILRDVTEAVKYRQQIEQQSQMLDCVSDAVSVVDPQGRITYWNQGAQRLFGWSAEEILGQNSATILLAGQKDLTSMIINEASTYGSWSGELNKTTKSGKTVIVDHRRTVLKDATGEIKGYLCIDIDITARKKQDRLSLRSQRLESIGTLAGGIAHDLNNVLTPILMGAKLLSSDRVVSDRQGLLNTMVASAHRGAGLVQQLLSFAGGIQGERSPIRIENLVNETRGLLEHTFPKSIVISTQVAPNCPSVLGDATELSQILMNLCINARDAMPDGGNLLIEADPTILNGSAVQLHPDAHPGAYVLLKVSDSGTGMSPEILDRIFDPFFTTKEIGKGTGLGLATVQGIVKSHGGFITVYSEPGRGSQFSVFLPAASQKRPLNATSSLNPVESGKGQTVLLVDDESTILQMTSAALEGSGYRILTANSGTQAVDKVVENQGKIDVVLLDMMMPGMDGLQTLDRILKIDPNVKVIACSGLRTTQRETEVLEHGAKAFVAKPYSDEQLLQVISRLLTSDSQ